MEDYDDMTAPRSAAIARFVYARALAVTLFVSQGKVWKTKRLHVEPKDLAKRIARHVAEAFEKGHLPFETTALPQAAALGYLALPKEAIAREEAALRRIH